jgi:hypothetical protein
MYVASLNYYLHSGYVNLYVGHALCHLFIVTVT